MMKKYKLTDQNIKTHNGTQWELGVKKITSGKENSLCNSSWLHYYDHPLLAVLMNPLHAHISNPRLFEVKAEGKHLSDKGLKGGCTEMTLVKEIKLPEITINQKVAFSILCSLEVYREESYVKWAENWLNGTDHTYAAARAACTVINAAANAADAAAAAANTAAYAAANTAAYAAAAATAYTTADAAADAAAYATANAEIDFIKLAKKALKYK